MIPSVPLGKIRFTIYWETIVQINEWKLDIIYLENKAWPPDLWLDFLVEQLYVIVKVVDVGELGRLVVFHRLYRGITMLRRRRLKKIQDKAN